MMEWKAGGRSLLQVIGTAVRAKQRRGPIQWKRGRIRVNLTELPLR